MANTGRYIITQKYLMTRGQAITFPAKLFDPDFKNEDVYGVVIDIPMTPEVLTTMVCFVNGAANLYFNNGGEYTGASQKYRSVVQAAHTLVKNVGQILPKCERTKAFDIPHTRAHNIFILTRKGIFKTELQPGYIPETEPEMRTVYVLYQRVLNELRSAQLKDNAGFNNNAI